MIQPTLISSSLIRETLLKTFFYEFVEGAPDFCFSPKSLRLIDLEVDAYGVRNLTPYPDLNLISHTPHLSHN